MLGDPESVSTKTADPQRGALALSLDEGVGCSEGGVGLVVRRVGRVRRRARETSPSRPLSRAPAPNQSVFVMPTVIERSLERRYIEKNHRNPAARVFFLL